MNTKEKTEKLAKMSWYAIRTQNNKERSVLEKLKNEVRFSELDDNVGRFILPTEKIYSIKNGKKTIREKIVYPGYIFIETSSISELSMLLKSINGAAGFVRTRSGEVLPMKESEVKKILVEQETTDQMDFTKIFVTNETVMIIDGPFTSFKGKITQMDIDRDKVKVEVLIFGRPTSVDLNFMQIEKDKI